MRLRAVWQYRRRIGQASACILIAAVCCALFPIQALGLEETTNAALWACVTIAAMAIVFEVLPNGPDV
jgi:hypothetical protein